MQLIFVSQVTYVYSMIVSLVCLKMDLALGIHLVDIEPSALFQRPEHSCNLRSLFVRTVYQWHMYYEDQCETDAEIDEQTRPTCRGGLCAKMLLTALDPSQTSGTRAAFLLGHHYHMADCMFCL